MASDQQTVLISPDKLPTQSPASLLLPVRLAEYLVQSLSQPVLMTGGTILLVLFSCFNFSGAMVPVPDAALWDNPLEIIGLFLMFSVMPAYLSMCFIATTRAGKEIILSLQKLDPTQRNTLINRYEHGHYWGVAVLIGMFYALGFNVGWGSLSFNTNNPLFATSVALGVGQNFMWIVIAIVLYFTITDSLFLRKLGGSVNIDLYQLDQLNGFGRAGLNGLLMVAGALTLTILQSLDFRLRWDNYFNGLIVGVPAALLIFLAPTWRIHRRIKQARAVEVQKINARIESTSRELDEKSLSELNALLQRRDMVSSLRTWPLDLSLAFRFIFYVLIPPIAWTGAALVEMVVDRFIQ